MNWKIILAGLKARPVQTGVTILAVALQVGLILVLVGLTTGTADEIGRRAAGISGSARFDSDNSELMTKDGFAASFGGGADFVVQKKMAIRNLLDFFPVPAKQRKLQQRQISYIEKLQIWHGYRVPCEVALPERFELS